MPMYEFFCPSCNTIYTFLSKAITTDKVPPCPKSQAHTLSRMVSRFAVTGRAKDDNAGKDGGQGDLPINESRMEKAMESLASEAENIDENNPRQAVDLMRKFSSMTGLKLGDKMESALARIEAGEDPEAIEQEMGEVGENDLFDLNGTGGPSRGKIRGRKTPLRDETLYEM